MSDLNERKAAMEALFTHFIFVGEWKPGHWGWLVDMEASIISTLEESPFPGGPRLKGDHDSQKAATDAAVAYIWGHRGDIVRACRKEHAQGEAYRAGKRNAAAGSAA